VESTLEAHTEHSSPRGLVMQERSIRDGRVEKRIRIRENGDETEFTESVRLFTLADFESMFARSGFTLDDVRGSYDGAPYELSSPRCIMFARAV
jgi:hypothetical protein